ncbi:neuropeptide Y receptor type 6-like [Parasteatoda tepidariorum]|uniref:neuropeptide Y receptor type 6-like n=1 Tax=Parasteatoda tepidariorum TaxID=114398 RepID=UPI001C71DC44|nr:neuropeptide Y receptor type 6-like [Parasteatoda tepidariorum]
MTTSFFQEELIPPDTNISFLPRLNFSFDDAVKEVERHLSNDRMFSRVTEVILIIIYTIIILTGIFCNVVIAGIIIRKTTFGRTKYPFVINLNVSDLILCLFCIPFTLIALLRRNWILGENMCKLIPFVQGVTVFLSSATVSVIAVDRLKKVLNAFPSGRKRQSKEIIISIISVWIVSLIFSCPVLYAQTVETVGLPGIYKYEKCIEKWPWNNAKGIYTVIILLVQFLIPAIVLFTAHLKIESHLNYVMNRCNKNTAPKFGEDRVRKELLRNRRATIVLVTITSVFGLTWLPWNIFSLIADFYPKSMSANNLYMSFVVCHMIAMTSATSNPILYGWLNSNIRKEIVAVKDAIAAALSGRKWRNQTETEERMCDTKL